MTEEDRNHRDIVSLKEHLKELIGQVENSRQTCKGEMTTRLEDIRSELAIAKNDIKQLEISKAQLSGKANMSSVWWTGILSFTSLVLAVISIVVAIIRA